jgi:hypothetical protein
LRKAAFIDGSTNSSRVPRRLSLFSFVDAFPIGGIGALNNQKIMKLRELIHLFFKLNLLNKEISLRSTRIAEFSKGSKVI